MVNKKVQDSVVNRFVKAISQTKRASLGLPEEKIAWSYLAIDNMLTGLISLKKNKVMVIKNHKKKIDEFFDLYPEASTFDPDLKKEILLEYERLWEDIRYENRDVGEKDALSVLKASFTVEAFGKLKMLDHFGVERGDLWELLNRKVQERLNEIDLNSVAQHYDARHDELERIGEKLGIKLIMKLTDISNFVHVMSQSDNKEIGAILRTEEFEESITGIYVNYLGIVERVAMQHFVEQFDNVKSVDPDLLDKENLKNTLSRASDFRHTLTLSYQGRDMKDELAEKALMIRSIAEYSKKHSINGPVSNAEVLAYAKRAIPKNRRPKGESDEE